MNHEEYTKARNALIPEAERYANQAAGPKPRGDFAGWAARWNRFFFAKMDELARSKGLISEKT